MKSERSIRGLACRWCAVVVLAMLGSLLSASVGQAQVQTFFVNVPAASEQRDAMEVCRDRFTAALVRVGGFRANQDAVTQQSVTDCLGETASASAKRECEVSMANIEVDFLILPTVRRLGEQWNWGIKALSPAQGAAQVWGGAYSRSASDPLGVETGPLRVVRGGSFYNPARIARAALRFYDTPGARFGSLGFRLMLTVP